MHTALLTTPYEQTGSTLTMLQAVIADKGESTYRMLYRIERTMLGGRHALLFPSTVRILS